MTQKPKEKSQAPHTTVPERMKLSEVDWQRFAAKFDHEEELLQRAIERLKIGDVSPTQHGIRVRVREDLGEYGWEGAAAFWPKKNFYGEWFCACQEHSDSGMCRHVLAAQLFRAWVAECQSARGKA